MEFSRPTKYISERAATVVAKLSSTNYRRSPLVQGGLEISYCVAIFMPEALKKKGNHTKVQRYARYHVHYTEPVENVFVGSFMHHSINIPLNHQKNKSNQTSREFSVSSGKTQETQIKDIRTLFTVSSKTQPKGNAVVKEPEVIEID